MKLISIVIPVFNEKDNILVFYQELCKFLAPLSYSFEFIFVDDGSTDLTPIILYQLAQKDMRVRALILAHNFGHQIALTCGLDHAEGDAVITMDGDMQHPPEMLPLLIEKWEKGFEVVQTIRIGTEGVSWFKKITSSIFYKVINAISKVEIQEGGSDFRLLDKKVVKIFRLFKERARFIRGMISSIGYQQTKIEFVAPKRYAGKSKFSLQKMFNFALDGITSYSRLPLRIAFYIGIFFGLISFVSTMHVLYIKFFTQEAVPGWATISASIFFLGGIELIVLGVIGEYIGRVFEEVKQRPLYWIREEIKSSRLPTKISKINKKINEESRRKGEFQ